MYKKYTVCDRLQQILEAIDESIVFSTIKEDLPAIRPVIIELIQKFSTE